MNALGQATVGLTVLAGEHTVDLGSLAASGEGALTVLLSPLHFLSGSLHGEADASATARRIHLLGGECSGDSSSDATLRLDVSLSGSLSCESEQSAILTRDVLLSGLVAMESDISSPNIIRMNWGAAMTIDFSGDDTYPLIVVSKSVEDAQTNRISVRIP